MSAKKDKKNLKKKNQKPSKFSEKKGESKAKKAATVKADRKPHAAKAAAQAKSAKISAKKEAAKKTKETQVTKSLAVKSKVSAKTVKASVKSKIQAALAPVMAAEEEVVLTNADGKKYCKSPDCDAVSTTAGYCRLHYIAFWKRNKMKARILDGGKLDKYIEDLTAKYPDKYLEILRKDLSSEKDFNLIVAEMDMEDQGEEAEGEEEASRFIEEVRGGFTPSDDDDGRF